MSAVCFLSVKAMLLLMDCRVQVETVLDKSAVVDNQKVTVKNKNSRAKTKSSKGKEYVELTTNANDSDDEDGLVVANGVGNSHVAENNNSDARQKKDITYSDVAFAAFGKSGRVAVDTALLVTQVSA